MDKMLHGDDAYRYSVAWIDCQSTGEPAGPLGADPGRPRPARRPARPSGRRPGPGPRLRPPPAGPGARWTPPSGLFNPLTVGAFNEFWFRKAPRRQLGKPHHMTGFFHPLDGVGEWNRLYGGRGFLQYQFVVPDAAGETVRRIIERLTEVRLASSWPCSSGSARATRVRCRSPCPGWTLALDLPVGHDGLDRLLDDLDAEVLAAGGRIYLAKDSRLAPDTFRAMYPAGRRLPRASGRPRVDPEGVLRSDLGRRLGLLRRRRPAAPRRLDTRRPPAAPPTTEERTPMIDATGRPQSVLVLGGPPRSPRPSWPSWSPAGAGRSSWPVGPASVSTPPPPRRRRRGPTWSRRSPSTPPTSAGAPAVGRGRCSTASATSTWCWPRPARSATRRPGDRPGGRGRAHHHQLHRPGRRPGGRRRRMRAQGYGRIVVLSSVAGERPRRANFVYGSTKSGLDAFAQGLGDSLVGTGVGVTVVRPGFVVGRMTEGMDPAPFSTTPEAVADAVVRGIESGAERRLRPAGAALGLRRACASCPGRCGAACRAEAPAPAAR